MSSETTNFKLVKPDLSDAADITAMNRNWDAIDAQLKLLDDREIDPSTFDDIDAIKKQLSDTFDGVDLLETCKALPRGIYYFKANCTNRPVDTNNVGFHVIVMTRQNGETSPVVKIMAFAYASNDIYFNTYHVDSHDWTGWIDLRRSVNVIIGLEELGIAQGSETILGIAKALPIGSRFYLNVTSTHNTPEYPYQTGTLSAVKLMSTRVTFEYVDNNGNHYSGTVRGSGDSAEWLGWIKNPTKASDIGAVTADNNRTDIPEGADLNSDEFLKVGAWRATTVARASSLTNCPVTVAFTMDIISGTGFHTEVLENSGYIIQRITVHTGETYFRYIYAGSSGRVIGNWEFNYNTRNITCRTSDITAGSTALDTGKIILVYE